MTDAASDICADFLIEARELVDQLGEQMVTLEHDPTDADCLGAVFRAFHTIKGGAGFLEFEPMVRLCHAVEDRLNLARSGEAALDPATFDLAQQSLDLLEDMLDRVVEGEPLPEPPAELIQGLNASSGMAPAPAAAPLEPPLDEEGEIDFDALLDSIHGAGGVPGAAAPAAPAPSASAPPPPRPPSPPVPAPAPAPKAGKPRPPAEPADATVRVDVKRLDGLVDLVGELVLARNRLLILCRGNGDEEISRAAAEINVATSRLQASVMSVRMQPVGRVFSRFPKVARDVARQLGRTVDLEIEGAETELDRNLVEALADPLVHLVRNAIDHGIEDADVRIAAGKPATGRVVLSARQEGDSVTIEVADDGRGIDPEKIRDGATRKGLLGPGEGARLSPEECLQLLFLPGFSTREQVSDLSGRGVGMDVVQSKIRELNGNVHIVSKVGEGSRFIIRVPLTLAILPALLVESAGDVYALPLTRVVEVIPLSRHAVLQMDSRPMLDLRDHPVPLLSLRGWLGEAAGDGDDQVTVVLQSGDQRFCLTVDQVREREEVVIKPLPRALRGLAGYAGATLVGDGRMAMILDVDGLHACTGKSSSNRLRER